jgi:hypothetical protein
MYYEKNSNISPLPLSLALQIICIYVVGSIDIFETVCFCYTTLGLQVDLTILGDFNIT